MLAQLSLLTLAALANAAVDSSTSVAKTSSAAASKTSSGSSSSSTGTSSGSSGGTAGNLTINTPSSLTTCEVVDLQWQGGKPEYFVAIIPGQEPSAQALLQFPGTNDTSYKWEVNMAAGDFVTIQITDSQGLINYADALTIVQGPSTSCVNSSIVDPAKGSSGSSPPSSTSSSSTPANTSSPDTNEGSGASQVLMSGATVLAALAAAVFAL